MAHDTPSLDAHALTTIVRALAEYAAMESVNERGRVYGPQSSRATEPDALTATEAASAAGVLTRGRRVHAVMRALPAEAQDLASWVSLRAAGLIHGPLAVDALALLLATERGPEAARHHLADARARESERRTKHDEAVKAREALATVAVSSKRRITPDDRRAALQRLQDARALATTTGDALLAATYRRHAAEGVLVAWGTARLVTLVAAWGAVDAGRRAA